MENKEIIGNAIFEYEDCDCYCVPRLSINGKQASLHDFGYMEHSTRETRYGEARCSSYFERDEDMFPEAQKKYGITRDEFHGICERLEDIAGIEDCCWCY